MTDNRTTELLRKLLDERGIKWKNIGGTTSGDGITEWLVDGMTCRAAQRVTVGIEHLALYIPVLTPEQAIVATLGSDKPPYDELLRCLENDWHIHASWDGLRKFWCIELTEEGVRVRDAARAERTCKSTTDDNAWCFVCSECGKSFPRSNLHLAHNHGEINYCPNCGARRVDA